MTACYLDASAVVKLATQEPESGALRAWLREQPQRLTSRVSTVEVVRALRRKGDVSIRIGSGPVQEALQSVAVIELDASIAEQAAVLPPGTLRSLDAIHLASALTLGEELDAVITYDARMADAARAAGLQVIAPG